MTLRDRLDADLKQAMKDRDALRRETIRGVRSALRNREIEVGSPLEDDGILRIIRSLVKQREDAIEQYEQGGRPELAAKESSEREVLQGYLPAAPDEAEVARVLQELIAETGAESPRDLGKLMKPALERLGPAADGKRVSEAARRLLAGG